MKKVHWFLLLAAVPMLVGAADAELDTVNKRYSYMMGVQIAQLLKSQQVGEIDAAAFAAAIDDVLSGRQLRLTQAEMQEATRAQLKQLGEQRARLAQANLEAGREFLAANAAREGIVVLPSGLQYRVLQAGDGQQAQAADKVRVHYHGKLPDGTVFDSSVARGEPAEFALGGVIAGFREALTQMRVGDKWEIYLPAALAYGERGSGSAIGPNQVLIFELELLAVVE